MRTFYIFRYYATSDSYRFIDKVNAESEMLAIKMILPKLKPQQRRGEFLVIVPNYSYPTITAIYLLEVYGSTAEFKGIEILGKLARIVKMALDCSDNKPKQQYRWPTMIYNYLYGDD